MSQWFEVREGIATGCVSLGAPIGGIFFSLVLQILFDKFPWKIAASVLAGMLAGLLVVGNLLVETNEKQRTAGGKGSDTAVEVPRMLRDPKFWLISYAAFGEPISILDSLGRIVSFPLSNPTPASWNNSA